VKPGAQRRGAGLILWSVGAVCLWLGAFVLTQARPVASTQSPTPNAPLGKDQLDFFESRIRPIFANNCYQCHSGSANPPKAGLELDWKQGWEKGGVSGPAIVPGDPDKSLLVHAIRYTDLGLQMPPAGKLSDAQINDLVTWVRMGAPDPRATRPTPTAGAPSYGGQGKNHWAFKPVRKPTPPSVKNAAWVKNDIDRFVQARLEASGMTGNEMADKRTLMRRAYFDLIGLPPTPDQVQAFLADTTPNAFERVVDGLLASPRYGERWGRHWLDVARYADSKGQHDRRRESTLYPYAWTYRDYVIKAFNDDLPYDEFIREQLAADRVGGEKNSPTLAALGFLTLGDHFNGNQADIINDRIDVTSKAFLGLTVTCARCHDHKFDPIPSADYYSLYGILASSIEPKEKPIIAPPSAAHADYLAKRRAMDDHVQSMNEQNIKQVFGDYQHLGAVYLLATSLGQSERAAYLQKNGASAEVLPNWLQFIHSGSRPAVAIFGVWNALARIPAAQFALRSKRVLDNQYEKERAANLSPVVLEAFRNKSLRSSADAAAIYAKLFARTDEVWDAAFSTVVGDAVLRYLPPRTRTQYFQLREDSDMLELVDAGAPARANVLVDSPTPKDSPIFIRGQVESPGDVVPRRFLEVLSGSNRPVFHNGSGRLELANAIASKSNPLTARVMVNRIWQHHFGDGFVSTPDDLGNQSSPPTNPELLDWLATRFMADNWSMKKLHKLILMSATWQQSTRNNPAFAEEDPFNQLLWRQNVRRLEFEPLRDSILSIGGGLDLAMGGHPVSLDEAPRAPQGRANGAAGAGRAAGAAQARAADAGLVMSTSPRRSVYGFVNRGDLADVFTTFDFASPNAPSGKRYTTIVPQQALFLMNSPLVIEQVRRVVNRDTFQNAASDDERIKYLYELFFQRPPSNEELGMGRDFVAKFQSGPPSGATDAIDGRASAAGRGAGRGGTARGGAQGRGRGGVVPPVRIPLSAWQELAHALLLTNEAAFVH
jgi:mono/diheme cytochrome c family protein